MKTCVVTAIAAVMSVAEGARPPNDNIAAATVLTGATVCVSASNNGATAEAGESTAPGSGLVEAHKTGIW